MLREIGLGTWLLIILTAAVVLIALSQTTALGPLAGGIGVTSDTALTLGQNVEPMNEATEEAAEDTAEMTPEAEMTDEAAG